MSQENEITAIAAGAQERAPLFHQRFDFGSYGETRKFLDQMADLSKREGYYPDLSFGKTYVNVSIDGDGQAGLNERKSSFIADMQALASKTGD
jgi:4a-hydroxytetrahydrobiopterin dehydratase